VKFLRISGVTTKDRNLALSELREAISGHGGWIIDHALFSNAAANINFEIPLEAAGRFVEALSDTGYSPKIKDGLPVGDGGDIRGSLQVTFLNDGPDMKRTVPAFG
jgi:hypothetical protein